MFPASGRRKNLLPPVAQITKPFSFPAPIAGVNISDPLAAMLPNESIYAYNLIPNQYGLRVRSGYREFAIDVGTDGGGRTIIPYRGSIDAADKLFVCSEDGIYDVTAGGDTFVAEYTFADDDATSGYGQFTAFTTIAGKYIVYCDETNGYILYDEDLGTWAEVDQGTDPGEISGVDPADLVSVCPHKGRLWFVERGSANAWYLAPGAITGPAVRFNFGSRFRAGGFLVNLYSWTVDGGAGVDDYLVAISSSGDVVVFRGDNPATATDWFQHGAWFIGEPPAGRRVAGSFGGELYILSSYGVLPLSRLLSGALVQQENVYLSKKIAPLIKRRMSQSSADLGWEITSIPTENILLVGTPDLGSSSEIQFALSLNTLGWGIYRDVPYFTGAEWNGDFYFSDAAGVVYIHSGTIDNVSLDGETYEDIGFSLLTSFQGVPPPEHFKRVQHMRPTFLTAGVPTFDIQARYDYNLAEASTPIPAGIQIGDIWDTALWDVAVWGGALNVSSEVRGGANIGHTIAVALRGRTEVETYLLEIAVMYDSGNML